MNLLFALLVSMMATTSATPDAAQYNRLYPSHIDFGTVPVWATAHPVRWSDLGRDSTSSVFISPRYADVMVTKQPNGYTFVWPLYTAVLNGDTLTYRLLGSDHDRVMAGMGYSDNTPYDLWVSVFTIYTDRRGRVIRQPFLREMSKRRFDQLYGSFVQPHLSYTFGAPLPPPQ